MFEVAVEVAVGFDLAVPAGEAVAQVVRQADKKRDMSERSELVALPA